MNQHWSSEHSAERQRLVRLCGQLSGSVDSAEDLAQQVLLEAWLHEENLRDPNRRSEWLNGISRNVCRRWLRSQGKKWNASTVDPDELPDHSDFEIDLERDEIADLLDRALAMLRPEDRALLIAHYIYGLSQSEIAERLGLKKGTLAVKLHRGRFALRRVLSNELRDDAQSLGVAGITNEGFVETDLWCFLCGQYRMKARMGTVAGELTLHCDGCCRSENMFVAQSFLPRVVAGIPGTQSAHSRMTRFFQAYGWAALRKGQAQCLNCGADVSVRTIGPYESVAQFPAHVPGEHGAYSLCSDCGQVSNLPLRYLVFGLSEVQSFWRSHPRLRLHGEKESIFRGTPVYEVRAESMTDRDAIAVTCSAENYDVLAITTVDSSVHREQIWHTPQYRPLAYRSVCRSAVQSSIGSGRGARRYMPSTLQPRKEF